MNALPIPPRKVTELVPLPAQPAQVKTPDVLKVTGSAFASEVPNATIAMSRAPMIDAFKMFAILVPSLSPKMALRTTSHRATGSLGYGTRFKVQCFPHLRAIQVWKHSF